MENLLFLGVPILKHIRVVINTINTKSAFNDELLLTTEMTMNCHTFHLNGFQVASSL